MKYKKTKEKFEELKLILLTFIAVLLLIIFMPIALVATVVVGVGTVIYYLIIKK